jgi:hypothetical protein
MKVRVNGVRQLLSRERHELFCTFLQRFFESPGLVKLLDMPFERPTPTTPEEIYAEECSRVMMEAHSYFKQHVTGP